MSKIIFAQKFDKGKRWWYSYGMGDLKGLVAEKEWVVWTLARWSIGSLPG